MTTMSLAPERRQLLAERFGGELTGPDDARYEELRRCHNGMVDKRPMLLVGTVFKFRSNCWRRISRSTLGQACTGGKSSSHAMPAAHKCANAMR